jgi:hypothetical protein
MNRHRRIAFPVVAAALRQSHNAGMKRWLALSLAFLWPAGGEAVEPTVRLHRCIDAGGKITWQNDSCPRGSRETVREMIRPMDPPKLAGKSALPLPPPVPAPPPEPLRHARLLIPPPPMYKCTSYDGIERFSESYDPNPRCEPMVIYYPYPNQLTPAQALSCRWVEDSCVRLSSRQSCERWLARQKEAYSDVQRAFSDTAAYRKSELRRVNQIVEESCSD